MSHDRAGERAGGRSIAAAGAASGAASMRRWVRGEFGMTDTVARDLKIKGKIYNTWKILQEKEFIFSLSACDLSISSIHLLVLSIFFSPTSKNHVKLHPPNTYKKAFYTPIRGGAHKFF